MKTGSTLFRVFALILITAFISSCGSKTPETVQVIPSDAAFVMVIDGGSLASKSGIDDLTKTKAFAGIKNKLPGDDLSKLMEFESIMKDPTESGIALNKESFLFASVGENKMMGGYVVELIDVAKFEALLTKQFTENEIEFTIEEQEGVKFIKTVDFQDEVSMVWKDNMALFFAQQNADTENPQAAAIQLLNNTKEQSIVSLSQFNDFYKKKEDISLWMNYESIMDLQKQNMGAYGSMINLDFSDCYVEGFLNFDKGKVEFTFETILNDAMQEMYKDFPFMKENIETSILSYMPETSFVSFAFGINMYNYYQYMLEIMGETIKGQAGLLEVQMQKNLGMSIQEALEAIGGDMIINVHGITTETYESIDYRAYYESGSTDKSAFTVEKQRMGVPNFTASLSIEDQKIFDVLIENVGPMIEEMDGFYKFGKEDKAVFFAYKDKHMFISNEQNLVEGYVAGKELDASLKNSDVAKIISKKSSYFSINLDIDAYPEGLLALLGQDNEELYSSLTSSMAIYDKVEFIPNDNYSGSIILWMKNEKANSLQLMIQSADESIAEMK